MKTGKTYVKGLCFVQVLYADDKSALVETLPRKGHADRGTIDHDGGFRFNVPSESWDQWTFSAPIIERELWVNIYRNDPLVYGYGSKTSADAAAGSSRTACKKVYISCREGEFDE